MVLRSFKFINFKQNVHAVSQVAANTKYNQANRCKINYWLQEIKFSSAPRGGGIWTTLAAFFNPKSIFMRLTSFGLKS